MPTTASVRPPRPIVASADDIADIAERVRRLRASIETAAVSGANGSTAQLPVFVECFGAAGEPLPLEDQERELRIKAEGLLMEAEMLVWARTSCFSARGNADRHRIRMEQLIKGRSEAVRERMARERGLP